MHGLAYRRYTDEKKALERWKYYHLDSFNEYLSGYDRYGLEARYRGPVVGIYRKNKGCECRGCTANNWVWKHQLHIKLRRESKMCSREDLA